MSQTSQPGNIEVTANYFLEAHLKEFEVLKAEQIHRIQFRDNQVYANLAAVGAVALYALGQNANPLSWLVIPWVNLILGGAYLLNDQKVSAIGRYFRRDLGLRILDVIKADTDSRGGLYWGLPESVCAHPVLFGWEVAHRSDAHRFPRKALQFILDLATFVLPGAMSLLVFQLSRPAMHTQGNPALETLVGVALGFEGFMLVVLTLAIWRVSDFRKGAENQRD